MEEIWKDIPDYEGIYQASNLGNIKSLKFGSTGKERILKPTLNNCGYLRVCLHKNKKQKVRSVHQLVAITFLNHKPCGMELVVNHKNFIRVDNRLENLEIVTARENVNKKHLTSVSKYTGVSWYKKSKKWIACIYADGKYTHLGYFDTEEEASKYYENAVIAIQNGTEIQVKERITTSKYTGVSWNKRDARWRADITVNSKTKYIGQYLTEIEAHEAVENALKLQTK